MNSHPRVVAEVLDSSTSSTPTHQADLLLRLSTSYGMPLLWRIKRTDKQKLQKPLSVPQESTDWVGNAIRIAELAAATGELLPFPYLKGTASLVSTLLKPIQVGLTRAMVGFW